MAAEMNVAEGRKQVREVELSIIIHFFWLRQELKEWQCLSVT